MLDDYSLNVQTGKTSRYQINAKWGIHLTQVGPTCCGTLLPEIASSCGCLSEVDTPFNAILGFPVLRALQRVTFSKAGRFLAGPDSPSGENRVRVYMDGLTPLLEYKVENRTALFSFDTGASRSVFSDRYRRDFQNDFKGLKKKPYAMDGAGGIKQMRAYFLPQVQLGVGSAQPVLGEVPVVPVMGTDMDKLYGYVGRDLVDSYRSFTIDFTNMRLLLGEEPPDGEDSS